MSDLTFYSYPKQLDAMIHIYTTSQKFLNSKILIFFLKKSLLLTKPAFILSSKSSNIVKYFYYLK